MTDEKREEDVLTEAKGEIVQETPIIKDSLPTKINYLNGTEIKKPKSFRVWVILILVVALVAGFFLYMWAQAPKGLKIDSIKDGYIDSISMEFTISDLHGYQPKELTLGIEYNKIVQSSLFPGEEIKPGKYLVRFLPGNLHIGENEVQLSLWVEGKNKPIVVSNVARFIVR